MQQQAARWLPGQVIARRFRLLAFLGAGAQGSVFLATDLFDGAEVALKLGPVAQLAAEYRRLASLSHPHLLRARALWPAGDDACLAIDYARENLGSLRGGPPARVVRHVAEVARALGYLHQRGIVHGDVKPDNALLSVEGRALLSDLGLAGAQQVSRGSLEYAAPEVLEGAAPGPQSDLYSLGVMLHELLSGTNPFSAPTAPEVIRKHFEPFAAPPCGSSLQSVVLKLLAREPAARYATADEVIEALAAAQGLELELEGDGLPLDRLGRGQLFGRDTETQALAAAAIANGKPTLVIAGPAGAGRSRLLEEGARAAELAGLRVVRVAGPDGAAALEQVLSLLSSVGSRLAVFVDDLHRAGPSLRERLEQLAGSGALVVVAQEIGETAAMRLGPLPAPMAREKLQEALGQRPWAAPLVDLLLSEVPLLPGLLEASVRDLAARGLLVRSGGRWALQASRAGRDLEACIPGPARLAARAQVGALDSAERQALAAIAAGGEVAPEQAAALIGKGLVREIDGRLRCIRRSIGAAALAGLSRCGRRAAWSQAAGAARDPALRAALLLRAGRGSPRLSIAAARHALRSGKPLEAARLYQIAVAARRAPFDDRRAAILCERSGDALSLAGSAQQATAAYGRALARGAPAPRVWEKLARARWQQGRFEAVLGAARRAREGGADPLAVGLIEARAEAMLGRYPRAEELASGLLPLVRSRGDVATAARLHHLLGTCCWHRGEGRRAVAHERTALRLARRAGDAVAESDARAGLGSAYRVQAKYARSARETAAAIELYRRLGDARQEAIAWNNLGVTRYLAADWTGALEAWEGLRERAQAGEQELLTLNNLAYLYRERGDFARARELLERALSRAQGFARLEATLRGNLGETCAREGDLAAAETLYGEALQRARELDARDEEVETERRICELYLLRRMPALAGTRATAALELAVRTGNHVEEGNLQRVLTLVARARGDAPAAQEALDRARAALERAAAVLELARLDCVQVLVELDRGDAVLAGAALRRARVVFERLGVAPDLRETEALQREVDALHRRSISQVDALTSAAQQLAAHTDPAALLEAVLDQALFLTGAERGFVLLREGAALPRIAAVRGAEPGAVLRISRSVADKVLRTGEVVAVADIVGREQLSAQKSILDLGLRSVLCAPISFANRQLGVLYVDSRRVGAPLSSRDLNLLSAFAALAGSALENARLIDDLRRKTKLLGDMAHELRNPLSGIRAYADLLRGDGELSPAARQDVEVISTQAQRLGTLIDRTLELARMEAGAAKMARSPVALERVASEAIAGLRPLATMKSIEIALEHVPEARRALGDFDRLVQVVTNLVANAIQYSKANTRIVVRVEPGVPLPPPVEPRVEIDEPGEPAASAAPPESVRLSVSDQGPGMSKEHAAKLFTPFFRAGATKSRGTGLGLVITREIVKQHGGEIEVQTEPGQGTTFTVVLPGTP